MRSSSIGLLAWVCLGHIRAPIRAIDCAGEVGEGMAVARGDKRVLVGVFGAAQGVRGEVRLKSYTGEARDIGTYGPLSTEDGGRSFKVLSLRAVKDDILVARIEGIDHRDAAAALTNTRLFVPRDRLPPPDAEEFYHIDLVGLLAQDEGGASLGRVEGVENYGAGDILEIAPDRPGETLLVPFTLAFVPTIDFATGRLVVARGALVAEDEGAADMDGA